MVRFARHAALLSALFVASVAWSQEVSFKNLIPNPGFATPDAKNPALPAGWTQVVGKESKGNGQPVFTYEKQGPDQRCVLSIACPKGDEFGTWQTGPIDVTPGKDYTLVFDYYCAPDASGGGQPEVAFAGKRDYLDQSVRTWKRHSMNVTAKTTPAVVYLQLYYRKGQKVVFSNMQLLPSECIVVPDAPAMGALLNDGTVSFAWKPVPRSPEYVLALSKDKNFPADQTETVYITADASQMKAPLASGSMFCQLRAAGPTGPGEVVADGSITLECKPIPPLQNSTLLLSSDGSFPADKTKTFKVTTSPLKLEQPLAVGTWFWKVVTADAEGKPLVETAVQEFLVAPKLAFQTADTTPPVVNHMRPVSDASSVNANSVISANLSDVGSGIDLTTLKVVLDGQDVTKTAQNANGAVTVKPAAALAKGIHKVEVSVKDKAGNVSNVASWRFSVGEPMKTVVKLRADRRCEINGDLFFPIGVSTYSHRKLVEEIADGGFNTILNGLPPGQMDNLNYIAAAGLKATCGIFITIRDSQEPEPLMTKYFSNVVQSQNPAFLAYWADEPKGKDLPAMKTIYEIVKRTDPNHPLLWCIAEPGLLPDYAAIGDGLMPDPYPYWFNTGFTQVSDWVTQAGKASAGKKPVWPILEAFDSEITGDRGTGKPVAANHVYRPTPSEIRCMTYLALATGATGINYWASDNGKTARCDIANYPKNWAGLLQTASEMRNLTPMLLATDDVAIPLTPAGQGIVALGRKFEGRTIAIVVNPTDYCLQTQIQAPKESKATQVRVLFEDRTTALNDNAFADIFRPREAHVYEFTSK